MSTPVITSEGDLEVVVLLEAHSLLADLIGPVYYTIGGVAPEQTVDFRSETHFDFFLVRAHELLADGQQSVSINGQNMALSLLDGLKRICARHPYEAQLCGLVKCLDDLQTWLHGIDRVRVWCSEVSFHVNLDIPHEQIIAITANATKHHLLRLAQQVNKVGKWCTTAGYSLTPHELLSVHTDLIRELCSGLQYYGTVLVELLGNLFLALNRLVTRRYTANPTNDVSKMQPPTGVTSDFIRNLYGELLIFHNYHDDRIAKFTPAAGWFVRNSYWRWIDC